jgi:uncharacterized protein YggE
MSQSLEKAEARTHMEQMQMRHTIFGLLAALALALSLLQGTALAQEGTARPAERLLTVTGEGVVRARPDMAVITLGMVSQAESARDALAQNTAAMTEIIDALRGRGIASRDLQTSNFSVSPVYSQPPLDHDPNRPYEPEIIGYSVHNDLTVRIRDLETVGALLDEIVTLGANSVSGPIFTVADPADIEDQARRAAMRDAIRRGELYAEAAEVALGPIARIEESFAQIPPPQPYAAMRQEMAADSAVPIEGGELEFTAQVSVSWIIGE